MRHPIREFGRKPMVSVGGILLEESHGKFLGTLISPNIPIVTTPSHPTHAAPYTTNNTNLDMNLDLDRSLSVLFHDYRTHLRTPMMAPDIHRTMCTFMRLELQLFIKLKHLFEYQLPIFNLSECAVPAKDIREVFPVDIFNEILVEYFDACMSSSDGNVEVATNVTKAKFDQI